MGEYVNWKGDSYKIGTCEDLYYVTYNDLVAMVEGGATKKQGNLAPRDYLSNGFRYRFPFPDEDRQDKSTLDDFDRGVVVHAPQEVLTNEHDRICRSLGPKSGGYNINAFIVCPLDSKANTANYSRGPHSPIVEICQQKAVGDCLWVVLRCPYCGAKWRLDLESATTLVDFLRDYYPRIYSTTDSLVHYVLEIADRIEAGYTRKVG